MSGPLSPTVRTTVVRGKKRAVTERDVLHEILRVSPICHLGLQITRDEVSHPLVLPTAFGFDLDGPDEGGSLYLHGSVAARSLVQAPQTQICVTFTVLDGLVLARSGFNHSMNYRSAVVIGAARAVTEPDERERALDLIVDQVVPGRAATLRRPTRKELAATAVIAVGLREASVKVRADGAIDEPEDVEAGAWAGVVNLQLASTGIRSNDDAEGEPPAEVLARAERPWG